MLTISSVFDTCTGQYKPKVAACQSNDWDCLCTQQTNLVTCYNDCPNDANAYAIKQQQKIWCDAAKQYV